MPKKPHFNTASPIFPPKAPRIKITKNTAKHISEVEIGSCMFHTITLYTTHNPSITAFFFLCLGNNVKYVPINPQAAI